jgi:hypothetical protein
MQLSKLLYANNLPPYEHDSLERKELLFQIRNHIWVLWSEWGVSYTRPNGM